MIAEKCHKKLGWGRHATGEWSGENATWHIARGNGYTLCGCKIGTERKGWFIYSYPEKEASCKRCEKIAQKEVAEFLSLTSIHNPADYEY
jgi:hypothetical protein